MNERVEDIGFSENIEPMFKVEPPFTRVAKGHGFIGVVLRETAEDKLQCHECGDWVNHLPSHAWQKHKIKNKDYRMKYGLPLSVPLVSKNISKKLHDLSIKSGTCTNFAERRGAGGRSNNNAKYARTNASFHNKHGLCEKQMYRRYLLIADIVERDPSEKDILAYDSPLAWAIRQRHGSINKFKRQYNFKEYKFRRVGKALNKMYDHKDEEKWAEMAYLTKADREALVTEFGSLRSAIAYIGKEQ